METTLIKQFIKFPNGRVSCIRGKIYYLYGMIIGSFIEKENLNENANIYRIPLVGEEYIPLPAIIGNNNEFNDIVISSSNNAINIDVFCKFILAQKKYDIFEGVEVFIEELRKKNIQFKNSFKNFITVDILRGDIVFIENIDLNNDFLIAELALIQSYTNCNYIFKSDKHPDSKELIDLLVCCMNNIKFYGLYMGSKDDKITYYDGIYKYNANGSLCESISFSEYIMLYPNAGLIIKPLL